MNLANLRSYVVSIGLFVALMLIYVGERLVTTPKARAVASLLGVAIFLAVLAIRAMRFFALSKAESDRKSIEQAILGLYLLVFAGLILYASQSDLMGRVLAQPMAQAAPKLSVVLAALWPAALSFALIPLFFVEMSYASMFRAPKLEAARVREALFSGFGVVSVLVFAFCAVYVATERDAKWDLSHFRTARPGDATRHVVSGLNDPVTVSVFFPPANEVKDQVIEYLTDLQKESPNLKVVQLDQAVDPAKARELGVSANGTVVVAKAARKEQMTLGVELDRARGQLRTLDQDFQKRLLQVARERRTVYLTIGHGERGDERLPMAASPRAPINTLREVLGSLNLDIRNLGAMEGLVRDVPKDAAAVFLVGPTKPLMKEESEALVRYVRGGGRLFVALDPEAGQDFAELLGPLGIRYSTTTLVDDAAFLTRSGQKSDRVNIATNGTSSHPSVATLGQMGHQAPVVLLGAGSFDFIQPRPADLKAEGVFRSQPTAFNDLNNNFDVDAPVEQRKAWDLEMILTVAPKEGKKDEGRAVFLADSDAISDLVMRNAGNLYLLLDATKWLAGEEGITGQVSNESDVPVQHTKAENVVFFYLAIVFVPALILCVGYFVARRRRPRARKTAVAVVVSGGAQ